jgi:hypothetical protein
MRHLSSEVKITHAITAAQGVAGATALNGAAIDMQGFEAVLMVVTFGAITTGAATAIKAERGADSTLSEPAAIAGSGQTVADTADGKTFYIDIQRPGARYVRLVVDRATQNAVVASAIYIQYDARNHPVTHGANIAGETFVDAPEGDA